MLRASPPTKTSDGVRRVKASDRPRAVAQTASRTPDRTSTSQDMTPPGAVLSLSGYGTARPGDRSGPTTILSPRRRGARAPEVMFAARPERHTAAVETLTRARGPLVVAGLAAVLHL